MLIEDVACPVDKLGDMTQDLVDMFQKYGYKDASCFGHALEGNLHLVFSQVCCIMSHANLLKPATSVVQLQGLVDKYLCLCQAAAVSSGSACKEVRWIQAAPCTACTEDRRFCVWQGFRSPEEVQRFSDMMEEMCYIVATKHSGSLKVSASTLSSPPPTACCCVLCICAVCQLTCLSHSGNCVFVSRLAPSLCSLLLHQPTYKSTLLAFHRGSNKPVFMTGAVSVNC